MSEVQQSGAFSAYTVDKEIVICNTFRLSSLIGRALSVSKSAIIEEESHYVNQEGKEQAAIKC